MKPTLKQQLWLKDYLYQVMDYRETYEEVYDHILAALENKPEEKQFETTVAEVIDEEFGGNNGLMEMEESCRNSVVKDTYNQYWNYWRKFLKFPGIIFVISLFIIIHFLMIFCRHTLLMPVFSLLIILLPFMLLVTRIALKGHVFSNGKTAFKDVVFRKIIGRFFLFT